MILIECRQGTPEWLAARAGAITASRYFDAISTVGGLNEQQQKFVDAVLKMSMPEREAATLAGYKTPPRSSIIERALRGEPTVEPSDTAKRYAADIAFERISMKPYGEPPKTWLLNRGHELEDRARIIYESRTGYMVEETGVVLTDDRKFGYSTDGMPEDDGLIEIKCPIDSIKIMEMWRTGDVSEYIHQIQGGMWITGRKWCDFIMYAPDLESVGKDLFVKRIFRDDDFIDDMVERLLDFELLVQQYEAALRGKVESITEEQQIAARRDAVLGAAQAQRLADETAARPVTLQEVAAAVMPPPLAEIFTMPTKPSTPPTLKLGQIAERLGFALTADFLRSIGIEPAATDKSAKLYHEADFPRICAALVNHINQVQQRIAA
jgi:exodeoxyribonuclease (lambda-induced)